MSNIPDSAVKDHNYDLIRVLEGSLRNAWQMGVFIEDAERAGDGELAEWFRKIQHNSVKAGEQGKAMLEKRLREAAERPPKPRDVAEKPGSQQVQHEHADDLADEWGQESFPSSDPPAHY